MKSILFLMMCMVVITLQKSTAQDSSTTQLIKLPKVNHIGFFMAPEFQYGQLKNGVTGFGGNSFMLLINKKLAIGLSNFRNTDRNYSPSGISPLYLHTNFHGLKMEYTIRGNNAVHLSFPLTIGVAFASTDSAGPLYVGNKTHMDRYEANQAGFNDPNQSRFMFVQPGVQVEANVLRFMKVYAGVTYRVAWKDAVPNQLSNSSIEGLSANAGIKIGLFEIPTHKKKK